MKPENGSIDAGARLSRASEKFGLYFEYDWKLLEGFE